MKRFFLLYFSFQSFLNFGQSNLVWTNTNVPNFPLSNIVENDLDSYLTLSKNSLFNISNNGNQINQIDIFNNDTLISLTLRVDMAGFVNNGGVVNPNGLYVVGEFNLLSSSYPNWTNSLGSMTNTGNNIWTYTFTYNQSQIGALIHFKFVNGIPTSPTSIFENLTNCSSSNIAGSRAIFDGLPSENHWVRDYDWNICDGFGMWYGANSGNDYLSSVEQKNGFTYVAGTFNSISGPDNIHLDNIGMNNGDYWLTKLDNNYNILWSKCFGGSKQEALYSMDIDNSGFIYLAGSTASSDGSISDLGLAGDSGSDYWIVKINENGDVVWDRRIKGLGNGNNDCSIGVNSVYESFIFSGKDSDDGDYLSGGVASNQQSYIVFKLSNQGNIIANKTISKSVSCVNQSTEFAAAFSVSRSDALEIDSSDNIFLLESYACVPSGPFNWNNDYYSSRIRKVDYNLNDLWISDFDDIVENDHFVIRSISLDQNNNILGGGVAQNITTCSSYTDASDWISCLIDGASGSVLWVDSCINPTGTTYTFTYDIPSWINDIQATSDGGYIAIGKYDDQQNNNIVRKYSPYFSSGQNVLDFESNTITIFPNPTSGFFQLNTTNKKGSRFKITNLLGSEIISGKITYDEERIDISSLNRGMYYLILENEHTALSIIKE